MLRLSQLKRALVWESLFPHGSQGACFGVTDASRLRPPLEKPMPPLKEGETTRKVAMVEQDGVMVPEEPTK